jgi:hypothetical protein
MGARVPPGVPGTQMRRDRGSSIGPAATAHLVERSSQTRERRCKQHHRRYAGRHSYLVHRLCSLIEDHDFNFFRGANADAGLLQTRSAGRHRRLKLAL